MPNHENTQRVTKNQIDLPITLASLRDPLGIGVTLYLFDMSQREKSEIVPRAPAENSLKNESIFKKLINLLQFDKTYLKRHNSNIRLSFESGSWTFFNDAEAMMSYQDLAGAPLTEKASCKVFFRTLSDIKFFRDFETFFLRILNSKLLFED